MAAIVSNNYAGAVREYLAQLGLADWVLRIEGRDSTDPALMKPSPYLLDRAIRALEVDATQCVFIGDQVTDIEAGRAARVSTIGYANKPCKARSLAGAGADIVVTTMNSVAAMIR